jgi:hypothetical protein
MRRSSAPAFALLALALAAAAEARPIGSWPYDELVKHADVVVLTRLISSSDSGDTTALGNWTDIKFVGVNTKFTVAAVLKGEGVGKELTLLHYRQPAGSQPIINGPMLAAFPFGERKSKVVSGPVDRENEPLYLLFLKRRADGRFEPVTRQVDSDLSVREVVWHLP